MIHGSPDDETLAGSQTLLSRGADPAPAPPGPPQALPRGLSVGRYVVIEQVGRGGMGIVYAAYDPKLDRKVALKVLMRREGSPADDAAQRRLMREAQAMAQVSHPNVVPVHDVGIHEGQVFMAMEFIDGSTLRHWLAAERRTPSQILALFAGAGRGLAAAHAKDLVHRDFKPDNVMVTADGDHDEPPRALVMDFGLVRPLEPDSSEAGPDDLRSIDPDAVDRTDTTRDEPLTRMGQLLGTPAFMAPEQFSHLEVDARADQFAFCVALWSALFGQPPFASDTLAELAGSVLSGRIDPPPASAGVDPRLRRILERGLSVDKAERWPSMDALLSELLKDRTRARRRVLIGVALAGAVALALSVQRLQHRRALRACDEAAATIDEVWNPEQSQRVLEGLLATGASRAADIHARAVPWIDRYAEQWRHAARDSCIATEVEKRWDEHQTTKSLDCLNGYRESLVGLIESAKDANLELVDGLVMRAATIRSPTRCTDEHMLARSPLATADQAASVERGQLNTQLDRVKWLTDQGRTDEAFALIEQVRPQVEAVGYPPLELTLVHYEAEAYVRIEELEQSKALYRTAIARALEHGALDYAADIMLGLASVHLKQDELDDGLWSARMSTALLRRSGEPEDSARFIDVLHLQAWLEYRSGRLDRALADAREAMKLRETYQGADHPTLSSEQCLVATIQVARGELDQADALSRRCVATREQTLGPDDPQVALALQQLGTVLQARGERDEAVRVLGRAADIMKSASTTDPIQLGRALGNFGMALNQVGRYREAETKIQQSTALFESAEHASSFDLATQFMNLGNVRLNLHAHEPARQAYLRALELLNANPESTRLARPAVLSNLANAEVMLSRYDDAIVHYQQALDLTRQLHGPEHPHVADILGNLANLHIQIDKPSKALELYAEALRIGEKSRGPEHIDLAYTLDGYAQTLIDLGRGAEALPLAERALDLRNSANASAVELATAQWTLAQALRLTDQDRPRALALAREALARFERNGSQTADTIREFLAEP